MRPLTFCAPLCTAAALSVGFCARPGPSQKTVRQSGPVATAEIAQPTPLVLAIGEGERRLRRFAFSAPQFTIKVDRQNGRSNDLVMGYEDLPAGGSIPPHSHRLADEILFVHRGSGAVQLADRRIAFGPGATIYVPKNVRVTVENTGTEPLGLAFIFSKPGFEELLRDISVREGEPLIPLSAAELTAIRKRHEWHTVYERP
jgi:quercetin dioxygenase-like cupin family protein